jgi:hypothetical protein
MQSELLILCRVKNKKLKVVTRDHSLICYAIRKTQYEAVYKMLNLFYGYPQRRWML